MMTMGNSSLPETYDPTLGISRKATAIARAIDRLPPGEFELRLEKPECRGDCWHVVIRRPGETVRDMMIQREE